MERLHIQIGDRHKFMKKIIPSLFLVSIVVVFSGCIAIHSTGFSNVDPSGGTMYSSQASGVGILSVTVPEINELEDKAIQGLRQQGANKNIRVRLEMRNFFVVQLYKVVAVGER